MRLLEACFIQARKVCLINLKYEKIKISARKKNGQLHKAVQKVKNTAETVLYPNKIIGQILSKLIKRNRFCKIIVHSNFQGALNGFLGNIR